tara:strand:- start:1813 stop:2082 length:270 start_codon:yes stop_codon:yes gene_type:complete
MSRRICCDKKRRDEIEESWNIDDWSKLYKVGSCQHTNCTNVATTEIEFICEGRESDYFYVCDECLNNDRLQELDKRIYNINKIIYPPIN